MKTAMFRLGAGAAAVLALAAWIGQTPVPAASRTFDLTYDVALADLPAGARRAKIWIPEAVSGESQTVAVLDTPASLRTVETRDPEYGNRILYAEIENPAASAAHFTIRYRVTRREYLGTGGESPESIARFLRADRLVPIDGRMKELADEIAGTRREPLDVARAVYDYVFKTLRYDKTGTGWGRGDAVWACDARRGNCTDFHSLFIALMRARGIPARFEIGFPLPAAAAEGQIPGYHCWAEFHVDGRGWIPVDISEAWKAPALHDYFFGHLDANRIQFSMGRDIALSPRQEGEPLNYFVYPYVEVDGKPAAATTKVAFRNAG
ncbi:MAG TPA: transglutaminase domain-containing protein [Thermoanaerobaculia bacterium]|nr:transglutaminase domain-containing protein [Thermoanaerobaculia bacterium]